MWPPWSQSVDMGSLVRDGDGSTLHSGPILSLVHFVEFSYNFLEISAVNCLANNCFQLIDGIQILPEDFPHCVATEKSQGCKVGSVRGEGGRGTGVLSSTHL